MATATHAGRVAANDRQARSKSPSDRPLDHYFDDLASTRRLTADEEVDIAVALRNAREKLWEVLLEAPADVLKEVVRRTLNEDALPPALRRRHRGSWPKNLSALLATADRDNEAARALTELACDGLVPAIVRRRVMVAAEQVKEVRDRFIASNLGLVVSLARRYERRLFSLGDLIQEGNTGLLKAVDRFDPERGYRFSTYAVWWIRHAIGRALSDRGREIRLPVHVAERQQTLLRARTNFEVTHARTPTVPELAELTGFSPERVEDLLKVEFTRATAHDPKEKTAGVLAVDDLPAPANALEAELDAEVYELGLRQAMRDLPEMQREVIVRRYGLDGTAPMTLREVGKLHDLSRERIRQLQVRALQTMRQAFESRGLVA